jgi:hypothetical protein
MRVSWFAPSPDGRQGFANNQLVVPGRYNFVQAAIYRLKMSNIPNRPGLELYPTLEVVPSNVRTDTFLAHSAVPVAFTDEDFDQVASGNYLVKVIYLPYPQFQDLATIGPDEVVSSRLEPGVDPIAEACRRGNILLVVRLGNIDLEAPNTPPMDAPSPYMLKSAVGHAATPGAVGGMGMAPHGPPGPMVPYGYMTQGRPLQMGPNGPIVPPEQIMGGPPTIMPGTLPAAGGVMPAPARVPSGTQTGTGPQASRSMNSSSYSQFNGVYQQTGILTNAQMATEGSAPAAKPDNKSWWERHWWSDDKPTDSQR